MNNMKFLNKIPTIVWVIVPLGLVAVFIILALKKKKTAAERKADGEAPFAPPPAPNPSGQVVPSGWTPTALSDKFYKAFAASYHNIFSNERSDICTEFNSLANDAMRVAVGNDFNSRYYGVDPGWLYSTVQSLKRTLQDTSDSSDAKTIAIASMERLNIQ